MSVWRRHRWNWYVILSAPNVMDESEQFILRLPLSADILPRELLAHADLLAQVQGIACFGVAAPRELCYCDRSPSCWRREDESVILCSVELEVELRGKCPHSRLIVVMDARASYIDLLRNLLESGHVEVSSLIQRPFGVASTAKIGVHSHIHPEARIDDDVVLGTNCTIHRGVWIQKGAKIGDGAVIGAPGINAYVSRDGRQLDFPHPAGVVVGEGAFIGANAVVMRGILTSTKIGTLSTIGNLCNIGHGVVLGEKCWMSVGCLIGGHTSIGDGATLGMGVTVRDNLKIGEKSQIGMGSVVVRKIDARASVFGNPARAVTAIKAGPSR